MEKTTFRDVELEAEYEIAAVYAEFPRLRTFYKNKARENTVLAGIYTTGAAGLRAFA